jgi:cytidylate kinase
MSIIVVTGPPGAGKTTVADALARSRSLGVHLVADQCFHWIVSGYVAPWLPGTNRQNATVIKVIGSAAARYEEGGYEVVVDGIVGPWFLQDFQHAVGAEGKSLSYVVLRPARDVALERALARTRDHDLVDARPVGAMYDVFGDLGLFESHVIDSSGQDVTATLGTIERGLETGAFKVTDRHSEDMARLARRHGI